MLHAFIAYCLWTDTYAHQIPAATPNLMKSKTNSSRRIAAAETDPEPEPPVYPSVSHSKPILPIWLQIGISVDHRRKNSSLEGLQYNVQRLKTYQAKLVVFPPRSRVVKAVDSTPEELANAIQVQGDYMPIAREKVAMELVTADMKAFKAYDKIRLERTNKRHAGVRAKRAADAEKEENK